MSSVPHQLRELTLISVQIDQSGQKLGSGAYGEVVEVSVSGLKCAGKTLHRLFFDQSPPSERKAIESRFVEECIRLSKLRHPNIVQFIGIHIIKETLLPMIVMELLPMSLSQCFEKDHQIPGYMKTSILCDVSVGLLYMHNQNPPLIHRDLTANNILLTSNMSAKIADLGVARILSLKSAKLSARMTQCPGTPAYMPPEALSNKPQYNQKLDVFSFGNLILHVCTQQWPIPAPILDYDPRNPTSLKPLTEIQRRLQYLDTIEKKNPLRDLAENCLQNAPEQRPTTAIVTSKLQELLKSSSTSFQSILDMEMEIMTLRETENQLEEEILRLRQQVQEKEGSYTSVGKGSREKIYSGVKSSFPRPQLPPTPLTPSLGRGSREKIYSDVKSSLPRPQLPPIPLRPRGTISPKGAEKYVDDSDTAVSELYTDSVVVRQKPVPTPRKVMTKTTVLDVEEDDPGYLAVTDFLNEQFTPDQLGMLRAMLEKMKIGEEYASPNIGTDKSIGYVMSKTAKTIKEKMLITEDDEPYYDGPIWTKAVYDESRMADEDSKLGNDLEEQFSIIPVDELFSMVRIGSGKFGEVFCAHYCPGGCLDDSMTVAVKKIKDDCPQKEKESLLHEMTLMSQILHPNIVKMYGVVTQDVQSPWVVLEYMPHGDLRNYLVTQGSRTPVQLVKYMVDIAMGMHYLAERGLVHGDLAARNILVGEGELCKVADFGLMRKLPDDNSIYESTSSTPRPIRWMAPECITHHQYSLSSDVWAFGILQWEMFNPKKIPYPNFDNLQVVVKITAENYRMPLPRGCPTVVARMMKACWHSNPKRRPSFRLITTLLTTKGLHTKRATHRDRPPVSDAENSYELYEDFYISN